MKLYHDFSITSSHFVVFWVDAYLETNFSSFGSRLSGSSTEYSSYDIIVSSAASTTQTHFHFRKIVEPRVVLGSYLDHDSVDYGMAAMA